MDEEEDYGPLTTKAYNCAQHQSGIKILTRRDSQPTEMPAFLAWYRRNAVWQADLSQLRRFS
jgi:hypothetical protein